MKRPNYPCFELFYKNHLKGNNKKQNCFVTYTAATKAKDVITPAKVTVTPCN